MKIFLKIAISLFLFTVILVSIWFSLDFDTKCKLIYGKNICNFYGMVDIASRNPSVSDFNEMMNLCREMSDVPKKDGCFEFIAEIFSRIDVEKARLACNEIKKFNMVHNKEDCYTKIQKPFEEKLAEATIREFMESRLARDEERATVWLTKKGKEQYSQAGLTLLGTSNPHFANFEILEIEKINSEKFRFKVKIYEVYTGEGIIGYFEETLTIIKSEENEDRYLIDSVERSEYTNL